MMSHLDSNPLTSTLPSHHSFTEIAFISDSFLNVPDFSKLPSDIFSKPWNIRKSNNSSSFYYRTNMIPRLQLCSLLIIFLVQSERDYNYFFIQNGEDRKNCHFHYHKCQPPPLCPPWQTWNYIVALESSLVTAISPIVTKSALLKYAVLVLMPKIHVKFLVRFQWHDFNSPLSSLEMHQTVVSSMLNYHLQNFMVYSPFYTSPRSPMFEQDFQRSIFRKEETSSSAVLFCYLMIRRVNATPTFKMTPSGPDLLSKDLRVEANSITIPLAINPDRWEQIDYTTIFAKSFLVFLVHKPRIAGYNFRFLFKPFTKEVWIGLTVSFLAMVIAVIILRKPRKISGNPSAHYYHYIQVSLASITFLVSPLLDQSIDDDSSISNKNPRYQTRIIFGLWILTTIVLSNSYKSNIVAFLVQPTYNDPPWTFTELIRSNYEIQGNKGFSNSTLKHLGEIYHQIRERLIPTDMPNCLSKIDEGNKACLGFDSTTKYFGKMTLVDETGQDLYVSSREKLLPTLSGMAISPFSDIRPVANQVLGMVLNGGLMDKSEEVIIGFYASVGKKTAAAKKKLISNGTEIHVNDEKKSTQVSLSRLLYPIYLLLCGSIGSCFLFLYEWK